MMMVKKFRLAFHSHRVSLRATQSREDFQQPFSFSMKGNNDMGAVPFVPGADGYGEESGHKARNE